MFFSAITKNSNWEILTKNLVTFLKDRMGGGGGKENQYRVGKCLKGGRVDSLQI